MAAPVKANVMLLMRLLLTIFLFAFIAACSTSSETDHEESLLGSDEWPVTCNEAIADLISELSSEDKATIKNTPREDLFQYHFGWGMGIRNVFGLWRGNDELTSSCMKRVSGTDSHPDTISMIIIEGVWESLNEN